MLLCVTMLNSSIRYVFLLLIYPALLPTCTVMCIQLILHPVRSGDQQLVVFDQEGSRTFCYPNFEEPSSIPEESLPTIHRNHGLDPSHDFTQLRQNARVICREVSGYTHLKRVYSVPAPRKMPVTNKRVKWMAECVGYEPLLSHCFMFNVSDKDSKCDNLLGIECGYCSGKVKLKIGESQILTNPEYPHYSDDVICEWVIQTPPSSVIEITFNDFELPARNEKGHCHRGLLEIKGIHQETKGVTVTKVITSLCGSDLPDPITIPTNGAVLRFSAGLFIPRPVGEDAGFNLTITAIAVQEPHIVILMDSGDIMAIVFAILLLFFLIFFACFVVRRYRKDRQSSFQRRLMQERLATQRIGRQDAALNAMLAASLHTMGPGPSNPSPFVKYFGGGGGGGVGGIKKAKASRTSSTQSRNAYATLGYPPPPPPPPLPRTAPPPLPSCPALVDVAKKCGQETDEEPLYMEATPLEKSFSYIQLDDIKCENSPAIRHLSSRPNSTFCSNILTPPLNSTHKSASNYLRDYPNNLKPDVNSSPKYQGSPRNVSCSTQNMSSNTLNLWPSTSSLTPSNKTVPLTPSREKALNLNFALSPWNNLSGHDSISSYGESISPFPGQTPKTLRRPSNLSQSSKRVQPTFESCHNSNVTLNDICSLPFHPHSYSYDMSHHRFASGTQPPPSSPANEGKQHPDTVSVSSCESVFTSGENITHDCKSRNSICKHCFPLNKHAELTSSTSHPPSHLSKSCGDVSPTTPLPEQDVVFDNMIQSAPALPGTQTSLGFVNPVLRRVSQMFLGSPSLYIPGPESKKSDDDTGIFFETSTHSSPEGNKIMEKKVEAKGVDGKGSVGIRKLGGKTISEASLRKDKIPLPASPRRPPASSVSSSSFMHYKYNLLEKESNVDRHALIPRSNSPEASDGSNSPSDTQAL